MRHLFDDFIYRQDEHDERDVWITFKRDPTEPAGLVPKVNEPVGQSQRLEIFILLLQLVSSVYNGTCLFRDIYNR